MAQLDWPVRAESLAKAHRRRTPSLWARVTAAVVDAVVLSPLAGLAYYAVFWAKSLPLVVVTGVAALLYKPLMESCCGATVGKWALGLRVVSERGERLTLG